MKRLLGGAIGAAASFFAAVPAFAATTTSTATETCSRMMGFLSDDCSGGLNALGTLWIVVWFVNSVLVGALLVTLIRRFSGNGRKK